MENKKIDLSVIIPTLNESENIKELLNKIKEVLNKIGCSYEILVIDGGSKDNTQDLAKEQGATVIIQKTKGYGGALKDGFNYARGKYILTLDADLSHYPTFIYKMWNTRYKAEMVIASRYISGGIAQMPFLRYILSIILNKVYRRVLSLPVYDISSGFRLYKSEILKEIDLQSVDFDILEEILLKIYINGYKVKEIPFIYIPRKSGKSNAKLFKFLISYIATLYKMWKLRNTILACDYDERAYSSAIFFQKMWQRKRYNIIINSAFQLNFVLDVGCGSSKILNTLPNAIGIDIDVKKMRYIRQYDNPVLCASIFKLPFKDKIFDGIICSEVIEHIKKDEIIWKEFYRVLKPGGTLIIGTPDYNSKVWIFIEKLYKIFAPGGYADEHISHYNRDELINISERYNFKFEKIEYVFGSEMIMTFVKE